MSPIAIAEKREELEANLALLEREQGVALLDGKDVDMAPIIAARDALSALDLAASAATQRDREAAAREYTIARRQARQAIEKAAKEYRYHLKAAQDAMETLAVVLKLVEDQRAAITNNARRIGAKMPSTFDRMEHRRLISRFMIDRLVPLGERARFGDLGLCSVMPVPDWVEAMDRSLVPFLNAVTGEE